MRLCLEINCVNEFMDLSKEMKVNLRKSGPPVNPTEPPRSGSGWTPPLLFFIYCLFVHLHCFYGWWLRKLGSGHWHPPMNPRETDSGSGIPENHRYRSQYRLRGRDEASGDRWGGGAELRIWVPGRCTGIVSLHTLAAPPGSWLTL